MELKTFNFSSKKKWIVTGAAGFIGSHLVDFLLSNDQQVIAIDNFLNGKKENIEFISHKNSQFINNFKFYEMDIRSKDIYDLFQGVDFVLHQAAVGSVPRSFKEPQLFNDINLNGFINVLNASNAASVRSFVYASSSSVYGDINNLPQIENKIGNPLSPYALSKRANEIFCSFYETDMNIFGLRYFNVFGKRQNPNGPYAAVIPKWIDLFLKNKNIEIYGDGTISRDFSYIDNVVQANILAALNNQNLLDPEILNIACGQSTSLKELAVLIKNTIKRVSGLNLTSEIVHKKERKGDIQHSYANITKAKELINFNPSHNIKDGLEELIFQILE